MYIAHYAHSPEDTAVGFGLTASDAAEALVANYPPARGKAVSVAQIIPGQGARSLYDLPELDDIVIT